MKKVLFALMLISLAGCSNTDMTNDDYIEMRTNTESQTKEEVNFVQQRIAELNELEYIEITKNDISINNETELIEKINNNTRYIVNQTINSLDLSDVEKQEMKNKLYISTMYESTCDFEVREILNNEFDVLISTLEKSYTRETEYAQKEDIEIIGALNGVTKDNYQINENTNLKINTILFVVKPRYDSLIETLKTINTNEIDAEQKVDLINKCQDYIIAKEIEKLNQHGLDVLEATKLNELLIEYKH